jgi:hypothetical protein
MNYFYLVLERKIMKYKQIVSKFVLTRFTTKKIQNFEKLKKN